MSILYAKGFEYLSSILEQYINGNLSDEKWKSRIDDAVLYAQQHNRWFTEDSIRVCLENWKDALQLSSLEQFVKEQNITVTDSPKSVALIMAGNIPLVGFHDFLCVLLTGNVAVLKLSSDDKFLLPLFVEILSDVEPAVESKVRYSAQKLEGFDAVIATGSNNSARYFEHYFGKYPHIIRKNRTSVAVLKGDETKEEIEALGKDIFTYYGLGCRNVSHLIIPENFKLDNFFEGILPYSEVGNHNKYQNNYEYQKAIYLLNGDAFLDNNFFMVKEDEGLFSHLGVAHYHRYTKEEEVEQYLAEHKEKIQCVVGKDFIPFGEAQSPSLSDFADGVNTVEFLKNL